jgi:hypothetical protein
MADQQDPQQEALTQIQRVYEDGKAEINGREYAFHRMTHKERRKVFAFFSKIQDDMNKGSFWWLESPEFADVEQVIERNVTFNGVALAKLDNHWEHYPGDYILFITTALGVISYPFMPAALTGSQ